LSTIVSSILNMLKGICMQMGMDLSIILALAHMRSHVFANRDYPVPIRVEAHAKPCLLAGELSQM
jgi:hypothetical protein